MAGSSREGANLLNFLNVSEYIKQVRNLPFERVVASYEYTEKTNSLVQWASRGKEDTHYCDCTKCPIRWVVIYYVEKVI